jgi:hypothetical protein
LRVFVAQRRPLRQSEPARGTGPESKSPGWRCAWRLRRVDLAHVLNMLASRAECAPRLSCVQRSPPATGGGEAGFGASEAALKRCIWFGAGFPLCGVPSKLRLGITAPLPAPPFVLSCCKGQQRFRFSRSQFGAGSK